MIKLLIEKLKFSICYPQAFTDAYTWAYAYNQHLEKIEEIKNLQK